MLPKFSSQCLFVHTLGLCPDPKHLKTLWEVTAPGIRDVDNGEGRREGTGPPLILPLRAVFTQPQGRDTPPPFSAPFLPSASFSPSPNYPFEAITLNKKKTGMRRVGVSEGDCLVRTQPAFKPRKVVGCGEGASPLPPRQNKNNNNNKAGPFLLHPSPNSHIAIVQKAIFAFLFRCDALSPLARTGDCLLPHLKPNPTSVQSNKKKPTLFPLSIPFLPAKIRKGGPRGLNGTAVYIAIYFIVYLLQEKKIKKKKGKRS